MSEIRNDDVGLFLARELEQVLARTFEVQYSRYQILDSVLPISYREWVLVQIASPTASSMHRVSMKLIAGQGLAICLALTCCGRKSPIRFAALGASFGLFDPGNPCRRHGARHEPGATPRQRCAPCLRGESPGRRLLR